MIILPIKNGCYLYRHIRLDKEQPFYIGIANRGKRDIKYGKYTRAFSKHGRNNIWKNIVAKTEYRVEILVENLTWEQACIKEKEFIKLYGRIDLKTGTLANFTDGGDGSENMAQEVRERIRKTKTGTRLTEEHKRNIGKGTKGKPSWLKGNHVTEEVKLKISMSMKSQANLSQNRIKVIDTQTGVTYSSLTEVSKIYSIDISYLSKMLRGKQNNNTNLKIL